MASDLGRSASVDPAGQHLIRGHALLQAGRLNQALDEFQSAAGQEPSDARPHILMAICLSKLDRDSEAVSATNAALARDPSRADAYRIAANAFARLRQFPEALEAANQAVRLAPDDWRGHVGLSKVAARAGNSSLASEAAARAGSLAPDEPEVMSCACLAALAARDWPRAEQWARAHLVVTPDSAIALANLGVALSNGRHHRRALDCLLAAAHQEPNLPGLRRNLSSCGLRVLGLWRLCCRSTSA